MNASRLVALIFFALVVTAACGDDDSTATTAAPPTTQAATTVATTTLPPPTTTTTMPTTTTLPPGAHPVFHTVWSDLLPDPAARGRYRVDLEVTETPMNHHLGISGDLDARMEYGVPWFGHEGTYDRLVMGLDAPDIPGLVFIIGVDDPWAITFYGFEVWPAGDQGRGPGIAEEFLEPATFDLTGEVGESYSVSRQVSVIGWGVDEFRADIQITLLDADAGPVEVAAGTFDQAVVYEVVLAGPITGGADYPIVITLSPGNPILEVSIPGASIELLEPWQ